MERPAEELRFGLSTFKVDGSWSVEGPDSERERFFLVEVDSDSGTIPIRLNAFPVGVWISAIFGPIAAI